MNTGMNDFEMQLITLWASILELPIEAIGKSDDFWMLGGDSIDASSMLAELLRIFGCEISQNMFYQSPTIGSLANLIQLGSISGDSSDHMDEGVI